MKHILSKRMKVGGMVAAGSAASILAIGPMPASADHGGIHPTVDQTRVCVRGGQFKTPSIPAQDVLVLEGFSDLPPELQKVSTPAVGSVGVEGRQKAPTPDTTHEIFLIPPGEVSQPTPFGDVKISGLPGVTLTVKRCSFEGPIVTGVPPGS